MAITSVIPFRIVLLAVVLLSLYVLTACAARGTPSTAYNRAPQSGLVRMRPDKSLEIRMLEESGSRVDGVRIVSPEHREYAEILEWTGPIEPGQVRPYRIGEGK